MAPPVGELSAKLTERATGRRSVIRSISAPRNVPNEINDFSIYNENNETPFFRAFRFFRGFRWFRDSVGVP